MSETEITTTPTDALSAPTGETADFLRKTPWAAIGGMGIMGALLGLGGLMRGKRMACEKKDCKGYGAKVEIRGVIRSVLCDTHHDALFASPMILQASQAARRYAFNHEIRIAVIGGVATRAHEPEGDRALNGLIADAREGFEQFLVDELKMLDDVRAWLAEPDPVVAAPEAPPAPEESPDESPAP